MYTRKELVIMETAISNFHTSFYIPKLHNFASHVPHVQIPGSNHYGDSRVTAFKRRESFQDLLCHRDYAEMVVASQPYTIRILLWKYICFY